LHIPAATCIAGFEIHVRRAVGRDCGLLHSVVIVSLLVQKSLQKKLIKLILLNYGFLA